ncbi:MAG: hypothetical protein Roseis2KO_43310 [Roseivirga sp.]
MIYQETFDKFVEDAGFRIVTQNDPEYPFARPISNSRFHYRPLVIAYCESAADVGICLQYCRIQSMPFRIRSGGHHHEGMSSGNELMVIDLSQLYRNQETNTFKIDIQHHECEPYAWIPSGMKLDQVYTELRKWGMIIPGGGCQSVNVGGLTQGGGWGVHVRKYGLACDQMIDAELVLADGTVTLASEANKKLKDKLSDDNDLLWALRGGGGGNFGVVTRFKFRLCPLNKHMTTFGIFWKKKVDVINMIARWAELHEHDALPPELSCTTNMWRVNNEGDSPSFPEPVRGRMGGNFYGTKEELIKLLKKEFGCLIPMDGDEPLISVDGAGVDSYFSSLRQSRVKAIIDRSDDKKGTEANKLSNVKPGLSDEKLKLLAQASLDYVYAQFNLITGEVENPVSASHSKEMESGDEGFKYDVLPAAPNVTCDMPHPHKVTSLYPKDGIDHRKLANQIYAQLAEPPFLADVNRYMVWHCLGGAMRNPEFENASSFAFRNKPYMLQLQSWWNHAGQLRNDKSRDKDYTRWINDFRKELQGHEMTEGAFINFVDKDIVEDISTPEGRLELLKHYYGQNLNKLREIKTKVDPYNAFDFAMGVVPIEKEN